MDENKYIVDVENPLDMMRQVYDRFDQLRDRVAELQSGLDRMMVDNSALESKVHRLEAELSSYNSATPSYVRGLEAEVERLRKEIETSKI